MEQFILYLRPAEMSKRTFEELTEEQWKDVMDLSLDSEEELFSPPDSPDIFIEDAVTAHMRMVEKQAVDQLTAELNHIQDYLMKFEERKNVTLLSLLNVTPVLL